MSIRSIHGDIRDAFLTEEPFVYAHLVKFERPLITEGGKSRGSATDYIYITDGSFDIEFDDGSEDIDGQDNGNQIYIANKLLSVGAVQETTEARATTLSIQISAAALNTSLEDSFTLTNTDSNGDSTITSTTNLVEAGFREGDLVSLVNSGSSNHNKTARIISFTTNNTVANVKAVDSSITAQTNGTYTLTLKNPEIEGIIRDKEGSGYARYINREVFVYKAFINPDTGAIIGNPYMLFKGIIAGGKLTEDPTKQSKVSWNITSHWGDFARVQGRLTSDPYHRALDQNNVPDPQAAIRPSYISDLGFLHSETAINLVAIYQVQETRTKMKMKRKWYGSKKYKLVEYQVEVDREADLRFNLEAKYLPVVYGVNKIDSIPVFVDTLNSDAKKVFVAYAICEGRVGGLYDIYFDDTSSICIDENDKDTRSTQTAENTIDVLCQGRADRGDTLTPQNINSTTTAIAAASGYAWGTESWREEQRIAQEIARQEYPYFVPLAADNISGGATAQGAGITHERGTKFDKPIDSILTFHAGLSNQKANNTLLSNADNFKVGTDYYSGNDPYWGAQHQLLDTAYVVAQYTIGEGETTIPSLDFVVRGKGIECYNYDFAYAKNPGYSSDNAANFNIGDEVDIHVYVPNSGYTSSAYTQNVVIADIFNITTVEGVVETRVRFKTDPGVYPYTDFYMTDGTNQYHMVSWNHAGVTGTCPGALEEEITSVSNTSVSGGSGVDIVVGSPSSSFEWIAEVGDTVGILSQLEEAGFSREDLDQFYNSGTFPNNTFQDIGTTQLNSSDLTTITHYVAVLDGMRLDSNASPTNDAYNNYFVEVTHVYEDNTTFVQRRKIIDYDGSSKTIKVDFAFEQAPIQGDTYKIYSKNGDIRVSTNPAIQLLDYLMDDRYGRNLSLALTSTLEGDIDGPSVFKAARDCDTRSNIHLLATSTAASGLQTGDVYKYTAGGKTLFHGKVKEITTVGSFKSIEFEEVLGKLVHRWEDWKYFYTGELYYYEGGLHKASSNGLVSTPSTTSSVSQSDVALTKVVGSGPTTLNLDYSSSRVTFEGNPVVKKHTTTGTNSGYSLYDSDDVKYWRYLGWEAQNQRHVTRHQTNAVIDTASPIFDNINSMLKHFNGVLRYANGKYHFAVMGAAEAINTATISGETYSIDVVTDDDIIGSIDVEDAGQKGTYNQVDVGINDPQNRFEGRSVMMFNSTYLKQDRMVPRKGTFQAPYVTNYYNARINAKQYLDQSRSGLKINFTMGPKGALLLAGEVIRVTHQRLGFSNKKFRISNLTIKENCLVQVTAEEHDDNTFIVGASNRGAINSVEANAGNPAGPAAPTNLQATPGNGGVELNWDNSTSFNTATYSTQIWRSSDNNRANANLIATTKTSSYVDPIVEDGGATNYYWIRHVALVPPQTGSQVALKETFSAYEPAGETSGVEGTAADIRAQRVDLTFSQNVIAYNAEGGSPDQTSITLTATAQGFTDPHFSFTVGGGSASAYSDPGDTNVATSNYTVPNTYSATPVNVVVNVKEGGTGDILASDTGTIFSVKPGGAARSVSLSMGDQTFEYTIDGTTPDPEDTTVTATPINTEGTVFYQFFVDGSAVTGYATPQSGTGANEFTYTPQNAFTDMPQEIKVEIREGSASSAVVATDVIVALGLKDGADALTVVMPNHSHSVPQDKAGNITFTGSGTTIELWEGTNQLVYDGTGTSANAGKWKIDDRAAQTVVTNVTQPNNPYTDQGNYVEVADLSGFSSTANTGSIKYKIVGKRANGNLISLEVTQSFTKTIDGQGVITVALDNPSHTVNATSEGTVADFGNAGTTISVFEGADQLNYEPSGNTNYNTAGTWTVSSSGSGITPDSITESNDDEKDAILGDDPTNMTGNNATITLTVTGKRLDGNSFTAVTKQSLSKARNGVDGGAAKVVRLRASTYTIPYTASGTTSAGAITLTADAANFDDPEFLFTWDGTDNANTFQDETTYAAGTNDSKTASFTPPAAYSETPYNFTVQVKENGEGAVLATDTLTVFSLKPGADNKQLVVSANHDNFVVQTSGQIQPSTVEFTANKINLTGTPTWSSYFSLYATASSTTPLSGSGLTRDNVFVKTAGLTNTSSVTVTATLTENSVTYSDSESIERLVDAAEEIVVSLSNDNVTLSANSDGEVISHTGSGTTISVFEGISRFDWDNAGTTAAHYKVTPSLIPSNAGATIGTPYSAQNLLDVTYPDLSGIPDNTSSFVVRYLITGKRRNGTSFSSTVDQTINVVNSGQDGEDALTIVLTNPAHVIPVDTSGNLVYTGSGTTVKVFEGTTALDYDADGTTTDGTYDIEAVASTDSNGNDTITPDSSPTDTTGGVIFGEASSLQEDVASITFTASGKKNDGTTFDNLSIVQSFSRGNRGSTGVDSQAVDIRADSYVIVYDETGKNPNPSSITLTADAKNVPDPYFKFIGGGSHFSNDSGWTDSDETGAPNTEVRTFTAPTDYREAPYDFTVSVKDGGSSSAYPVKATDTLSIASIKPGTGALTAILDNDNHSIPVTEAGTPTFTGSGTNVKLYEGAEVLTYEGDSSNSNYNTAGYWYISGISDSNVTSPNNEPNGSLADALSTTNVEAKTVDVLAITGFSSSTNAGSRTIGIAGKRLDGTAFSFNKFQTFTKNIDGSSGVNGVSINGSASAVSFTKDANGDYDPDSTSIIILSVLGATNVTATYTESHNYMTISNSSTSGATVTFDDDISLDDVKASHTVSIDLTGTTSDGTTGVDLGTYVVAIPTTANGADGTNGVGTNGFRSIQGYLYYEKSGTGAGTAPSAPTNSTVKYNFSGNDAGLVTDTDSTPEVTTGTAVNIWMNYPRPQDPTSSNVHWTVRYSGLEQSANAANCPLTFSNVVRHTNFTGVVTFNNGTFSSGDTVIDGSSDATSIDGGKIKTNSITADQIQVASGAGGNLSGIHMRVDSSNRGIIEIKDGSTVRVRLGYLG